MTNETILEEGNSTPSITRRLLALMFDSILVSSLTAVTILLLCLYSSNFCFKYHTEFLGPLFPISFTVCLLSPFWPWLNLYSCAEVYKMAGASPTHFGHVPEVLLAWIVVLINVFANLAYHTILTSSKMNATVGQRLLGLKLLSVQGGTVSPIVALLRSTIKLAAWTICSFLYWSAATAPFVNNSLEFFSSAPTIWLLSFALVACFDSLPIFRKAKRLIESQWQRFTNTETCMVKSTKLVVN